MILVKPIHPAKLNEHAIRAALETELEAVSKDILLDFELTTATWDHKVKFERQVSVGPKSVDILVGTDDEIYGYVNNGTRPHVILPKTPHGVLAFPSKHKAKTQPGKETAGAGGSSGPTVFAKGVLHPGTKARKFDRTIAKKWKPRFQKRMEAAMSRAAKVSGHGM